MAKKASRLEPQHRHWYEDLPLLGEKQAETPCIDEECNKLNEVFLEVSRSSSIMRGILLWFALFGVLTVFPLFLFSMKLAFTSRDIGIGLTALALIVYGVGGAILFYCLRFELQAPLDRPVRFNRKKRKIYIYEYNWTWNPFGRWRTAFKVFDWDNVRAEITRQRGFNGTAYIERYALSLAHCEPGTNTVLDRFDLHSGAVFTSGLQAIWAYCCEYMEKGLEGLPETKPRPKDIRFSRCFFSYYPFLNPTREGAEYRADAPWFHWLYALILFPVLPLLLLFGLGNYIVMRLAPNPVWPPEIDRESTSG